MPRPNRPFLIALLAAGGVSFLAGLAFTWLIEGVPCRDEAIGVYGVVIWAILGPLIFGLVLSVARNRSALAGAFVILLVPPIAFFLITQIEQTLYIGFETARQLRTLLVTLVPPALTVLVQYLILRRVVPPSREEPR